MTTIEIEGNDRIDGRTTNPMTQVYLGYFEDVSKKLIDYGVDWRVVGGLAIDAYRDVPFSILRNNGSVRDVDLIILSDDYSLVNRLREEVRDSEHNAKYPNLFPKISFNPLLKYPTSEPVFPKFLSGFARENDDYYIVFNNIAQRIDDRVFASENICIEGYNFPSFPPETIMHLYLVRGGYVKNKDYSKIRALSRQMTHTKSEHDLYWPFHDFAIQMRAQYPLTTNLFRMFFYVDQKTGYFFSNHDRQVYGMLKFFQYKLRGRI